MNEAQKDPADANETGDQPPTPQEQFKAWEQNLAKQHSELIMLKKRQEMLGLLLAGGMCLFMFYVLGRSLPKSPSALPKVPSTPIPTSI